MFQNKNTWENKSRQSLFPTVQAGPPNPLLTNRGELLLKSHTTGDGFFCLMGDFGACTTLYTSQTREGQMISSLHSSHKLKYDGAMDKGTFYPSLPPDGWNLNTAHWPVPFTLVFHSPPLSRANPRVKRTKTQVL